jgi:hypothetical protein
MSQRMLKAHPTLRMDTDITDVLAIVSLCCTNEEDASKRLVWYDEKNMGSLMAFSARVIDCMVGRMKVRDRWGIVDRCWGLQEAIVEGMVIPDYELEDDLDN